MYSSIIYHIWLIVSLSVGLVRSQDPFCLNMMEYYSTALWHLQVRVWSRTVSHYMTRSMWQRTIRVYCLCSVLRI